MSLFSPRFFFIDYFPDDTSVLVEVNDDMTLEAVLDAIKATMVQTGLCLDVDISSIHSMDPVDKSVGFLIDTVAKLRRHYKLCKDDELRLIVICDLPDSAEAPSCFGKEL